jgi:hypothetical protein
MQFNIAIDVLWIRCAPFQSLLKMLVTKVWQSGVMNENIEEAKEI